ncbi:MAG: hypothetical protein AB7T32_05035 [Dehalococcoidia bacterium]
MPDNEPIAVIEGPKGKAEIYELVSAAAQAIEYHVTCNGETQTFNNLGEAYITAGELAGNES